MSRTPPPGAGSDSNMVLPCASPTLVPFARTPPPARAVDNVPVKVTSEPRRRRGAAAQRRSKALTASTPSPFRPAPLVSAAGLAAAGSEAILPALPDAERRAKRLAHAMVSVTSGNAKLAASSPVLSTTSAGPQAPSPKLPPILKTSETSQPLPQLVDDEGEPLPQHAPVAPSAFLTVAGKQHQEDDKKSEAAPSRFAPSSSAAGTDLSLASYSAARKGQRLKRRERRVLRSKAVARIATDLAARAHTAVSPLPLGPGDASLDDLDLFDPSSDGGSSSDADSAASFVSSSEGEDAQGALMPIPGTGEDALVQRRMLRETRHKFRRLHQLLRLRYRAIRGVDWNNVGRGTSAAPGGDDTIIASSWNPPVAVARGHGTSSPVQLASRCDETEAARLYPAHSAQSARDAHDPQFHELVVGATLRMLSRSLAALGARRAGGRHDEKRPRDGDRKRRSGRDGDCSSSDSEKDGERRRHGRAHRDRKSRRRRQDEEEGRRRGGHQKTAVRFDNLGSGAFDVESEGDSSRSASADSSSGVDGAARSSDRRAARMASAASGAEGADPQHSRNGRRHRAPPRSLEPEQLTLPMATSVRFAPMPTVDADHDDGEDDAAASYTEEEERIIEHLLRRASVSVRRASRVSEASSGGGEARQKKRRAGNRRLGSKPSAERETTRGSTKPAGDAAANRAADGSTSKDVQRKRRATTFVDRPDELGRSTKASSPKQLAKGARADAKEQVPALAASRRRPQRRLSAAESRVQRKASLTTEDLRATQAFDRQVTRTAVGLRVDQRQPTAVSLIAKTAMESADKIRRASRMGLPVADGVSPDGKQPSAPGSGRRGTDDDDWTPDPDAYDDEMALESDDGNASPVGSRKGSERRLRRQSYRKPGQLLKLGAALVTEGPEATGGGSDITQGGIRKLPSPSKAQQMESSDFDDGRHVLASHGTHLDPECAPSAVVQVPTSAELSRLHSRPTSGVPASVLSLLPMLGRFVVAMGQPQPQRSPRSGEGARLSSPDRRRRDNAPLALAQPAGSPDPVATPKASALKGGLTAESRAAALAALSAPPAPTKADAAAHQRESNADEPALALAGATPAATASPVQRRKSQSLPRGRAEATVEEEAAAPESPVESKEERAAVRRGRSTNASRQPLRAVASSAATFGSPQGPSEAESRVDDVTDLASLRRAPANQRRGRAAASGPQARAAAPAQLQPAKGVAVVTEDTTSPTRVPTHSTDLSSTTAPAGAGGSAARRGVQRSTVKPAPVVERSDDTQKPSEAPLPPDPAPAAKRQSQRRRDAKSTAQPAPDAGPAVEAAVPSPAAPPRRSQSHSKNASDVSTPSPTEDTAGTRPEAPARRTGKAQQQPTKDAPRSATDTPPPANGKQQEGKTAAPTRRRGGDPNAAPAPKPEGEQYSGITANDVWKRVYLARGSPCLPALGGAPPDPKVAATGPRLRAVVAAITDFRDERIFPCPTAERDAEAVSVMLEMFGYHVTRLYGKGMVVTRDTLVHAVKVAISESAGASPTDKKQQGPAPKTLCAIYVAGRGTEGALHGLDGGDKHYVLHHDTKLSSVSRHNVIIAEELAAMRSEHVETVVYMEVHPLNFPLKGVDPTSVGCGFAVVRSVIPSLCMTFRYPARATGVFTWYLLKGLQGDAVRSGRITPGIINAYVYTALLSKLNPKKLIEGEAAMLTQLVRADGAQELISKNNQMFKYRAQLAQRKAVASSTPCRFVIELLVDIAYLEDVEGFKRAVTAQMHSLFYPEGKWYSSGPRCKLVAFQRSGQFHLQLDPKAMPDALGTVVREGSIDEDVQRICGAVFNAGVAEHQERARHEARQTAKVALMKQWEERQQVIHQQTITAHAVSSLVGGATVGGKGTGKRAPGGKTTKSSAAAQAAVSVPDEPGMSRKAKAAAAAAAAAESFLRDAASRYASKMAWRLNYSPKVAAYHFAPKYRLVHSMALLLVSATYPSKLDELGETHEVFEDDTIHSSMATIALAAELGRRKQLQRFTEDRRTLEQKRAAAVRSNPFRGISFNEYKPPSHELNKKKDSGESQEEKKPDEPVEEGIVLFQPKNPWTPETREVTGRTVSHTSIVPTVIFDEYYVNNMQRVGGMQIHRAQEKVFLTFSGTERDFLQAIKHGRLGSFAGPKSLHNCSVERVEYVAGDQEVHSGITKLQAVIRARYQRRVLAPRLRLARREAAARDKTLFLSFLQGLEKLKSDEHREARATAERGETRVRGQLWDNEHEFRLQILSQRMYVFTHVEERWFRDSTVKAAEARAWLEMREAARRSWRVAIATTFNRTMIYSLHAMASEEVRRSRLRALEQSERSKIRSEMLHAKSKHR